MGNIGIDLGTTHSLVAAVMGEQARCMLDEQGRALTPSVVVYGDDSEVASVGWEALDHPPESGSIFSSIKRFMGRSPADVAEEAGRFHYPLSNDDRVVRFQLAAKQVTPVEISAEILRALAQTARECLMSEPTGAVITVPAYFDDGQRQATRDAATLAGLNVLRLLNEPTAAALAYGLQSKADGVKIAVYDLGGGTFDVSILELSDGVFQVLSTAGDTALGGDDFDHALAGVLLTHAEVNEPTGVLFRRAVREAERAKRVLSEHSQVVMSLVVDEQQLQLPFALDSFERLIAPIVARTGVACERALSDAGLSVAEIDEVVLVGGSTRVPYVHRFVADFFSASPQTGLDPDRVVALGAAIQADILSGTSQLSEDVLLLDVIPLSLGVEVMGGIVERLVPRCSTIPVTASQTFTTHVDGQGALDLHVVQGEREMVKDNRSLAKFKLTGLPDLPAGVPRIKVTFAVNADGILNVTAKEQFTGVRTEVVVEPSYGLDEEEIEQMLEDAIDNAEGDVDERLLIEARVEATQVLTALEKVLAVDRAMLQEGEAELIGSVADALKAALEDGSRNKIASLTRKLDEVTAAFAQRRIERDLALALEGRAADDVAERLGV